MVHVVMLLLTYTTLQRLSRLVPIIMQGIDVASQLGSLQAQHMCSPTLHSLPMKCALLYSHVLCEPSDMEEMPPMLSLQYWGGGGGGRVICKASHAGSLLNVFSTEPQQRT